MIMEHLITMNKVKNDYKKSKKYDDGSRISDGYHTMSELYFSRMFLFSIIVNNNRPKAFKSKLHSDGTMYPGMFIVGIETKKGYLSYHIDKKYWDYFHCKVLPTAPEYDGHQPEDIGRLLKI